MNKFSTKDRDQSMTHTVSFHDVPVPRGVAFAIYHCEQHGAKVSLSSCIRTDAIIKAHNKQFGTNLHGQQWCIDMHAKDPANYAAANPVNKTSHCWYSDGSPVYKNSRGRVIPPTGRLPWYQIGIDLDDRGKYEDNSHFLGVAHNLGYSFVAPYRSGSERHHLVLQSSPISTLEHWNVIAKDRA